MKWTKEQQQVIDLRHTNLLISAAAGSGKTAVLVERILSLVTDPEHPVDMDRLLVVTFTRAAAGEMKDRIGRALEERLAADPGNTHLQKQGVLLHHAQISTIDGFCTFVLQNYFHRIDLDPAYRIAEEDDLKLLRGRVLETVLEEEYAEGSEAFLRFVEAYGSGRSDRKITELISRLYDFSVSDPDPDLWLERCLQAYRPTSEEELEKSGWMQDLVAEAGHRIEGLLQAAVQLREFVVRHPEVPQMYLPALQSDVILFSELTGMTTYRELQEALRELHFETLGRKKQPDVDPILKEQVKKQRDTLKKQTEELRRSLFAMSTEQILEDLQVTGPHAEELVRLVRRFGDAYTGAKRKSNLLDFPDLEHLALQILTERGEDGVRHPTAAAKELADRFEEVMIDEYQDSNFLQEAILTAVSGKGRGEGNRFMVGDIKQSIYGFRQARPELFLEKTRAFSPAGEVSDDKGTHEDVSGEETSVAASDRPVSVWGTEQGVRIDLHRNFRSRAQVLDTANALFVRLMRPELGGITYDETAALHPAADYPEAPEVTFPDTELLIVDKGAPEFDEDRSRAAVVEAEAHAAAGKIRECRRSGRLWDAEKQTFRPVKYRDCVILLRAAGTWGDTFVRVLQSEGIPAYTASGKGYFTTVEVSTVLNYLRICDNPRQDIPLAAVLRSPIGGMQDEELAQVRIGMPEGTLLEALQKAAAEQSGSVSEKAGCFLAQLESFRERVPRMPVHTLIRQILQETGYGDYAAAMPAGAQRQANLEMLVERAAAYEKNDYHGLFRFVRYIEQLKEREVDFGEVSLYGEEENIVRIMTIHKSKGLEFPIVILAGIDSSFNRSDEKSAVVLHAGLGLGMTAVYTDQRRIRPGTALRAAVQNAVRHDALAEELRVLYVAVTRAREKLILIGAGDGETGFSFTGGSPTYQQLIAAKSFQDWILLAESDGAPLKKTILRERHLTLEEAGETLQTRDILQEIRGLLREGHPGDFAPELQRTLAEIETFCYADDRTGLPAKLTVSELKRLQSPAPVEEEQGEMLFPEETVVPYVPRFMSTAPETEATDSALSGAARGTAYHRVLAVLEYGTIGTSVADDGPETGQRLAEAVREQLDRLRKSGLLSEAEYHVVRTEDITEFLRSPLGRRMTAADAAGTLHREQPFVLDVPAEVTMCTTDEVVQSVASGPGNTGETVLIQGTIDAYWMEDGGYVLVDYKTDHVRAGEERFLAERYRVQLVYYRMALEQITGMPVREMYIYALATGACIAV